MCHKSDHIFTSTPILCVQKTPINIEIFTFMHIINLGFFVQLVYTVVFDCKSLYSVNYYHINIMYLLTNMIDRPALGIQYRKPQM